MDVVVVGAGPGGCVAAWRCAKLGLRVALIEAKPGSRAWEKVCGDAVGSHHFEALGLPLPSGEEVFSRVEGVKIYSPDRATLFKVEGEGLRGFIVNRRALGLRLLREALDAGVELIDEAQALAPIMDGGAVSGVLAKRRGEPFEVRARVVVDASGYPAIIRRRCPPEWFPPPLPSDYVVCYREVRRLEEPLSSTEYCEIYLDQESSPGGYVWVFPRGKWEVNVGLGVQAGGGFNPRQRFYSHVLGRFVPPRSEVVHLGGGVVPTRRPLDCLAGDGVVLVGDAACQANPIHGGGIGPAMRAGWLAAEAISKALDAGDPSRRGLWSYAVVFNTTYGFKQASLDAFRVFLQSLSNEDLNWGMRARLMSERDVLIASLGGGLKLSFTERAKRLLRGAGRLSLLFKLRATLRAMSRLRELYLSYPGPEGLEKWRAEVASVFEYLKAKLS
ncbi:MAG: NAD(P)/FAD-dependent oxidoreductase [Candidatus Nezhaarchaeota archaeon]|nr:NAD(P)/FAD-dependent oxidoreductase [Candidatus Nezhaarchaeota archaeon]